MNKLLCLFLGHDYIARVELDKATETIICFYACERCGKRSMSLFG